MGSNVARGNGGKRYARHDDRSDREIMRKERNERREESRVRVRVMQKNKATIMIVEAVKEAEES